MAHLSVSELRKCVMRLATNIAAMASRCIISRLQGGPAFDFANESVYAGVIVGCCIIREIASEAVDRDQLMSLASRLRGLLATVRAEEARADAAAAAAAAETITSSDRDPDI